MATKQEAERARARLAQAMRTVFGTHQRTTDQQIVLEWLAMFCRANETEFHADPRLHAVLSGRREVWLSIQQHLHLTDQALWALYSGVAVERPAPPTLTEEVKDKDD